jgi:hypothetical protein
MVSRGRNSAMACGGVETLAGGVYPQDVQSALERGKADMTTGDLCQAIMAPADCSICDHMLVFGELDQQHGTNFADQMRPKRLAVGSDGSPAVRGRGCSC